MNHQGGNSVPGLGRKVLDRKAERRQLPMKKSIRLLGMVFQTDCERL